MTKISSGEKEDDTIVVRSAAQAEILACRLLQTGFNLILQMATGSGKTWLAERAIESVLNYGGRAIYLSPLRAQASEVAERWRHRFAGTKIGIFTGDYGGTTGKAYPVSFRDARVLVLTPERLDACMRTFRSHWEWLPVMGFGTMGREERITAVLAGKGVKFGTVDPCCAVLPQERDP